MAIDPRQLPLDRSFDDDRVRGEALAPGRLTPAGIRQRFLQAGPWTPELRSDAAPPSQGAEAPRPAAVLVPLVRRDDQLNVLLTHRARHLQDHAGQISFPGGRIEPSDRGAVDAALRESGEETGLPIDRIEIFGTLPIYLTVTRFEVTPVVGMIAAPIELRLDAGEVEDAFEVPFAFLMNPRNHQRRLVTTGDARRFVYTIPYDDGRRERMIWGVTAAIVRNLYGFLRG
ncbi:MAG TPA: CoA pyrophosphatase [Burkholderiaceae bacterium]|nr:CoA pyrophosphatase [Burkholderiaceae bacterium]